LGGNSHRESLSLSLSRPEINASSLQENSFTLNPNDVDDEGDSNSMYIAAWATRPPPHHCVCVSGLGIPTHHLLVTFRDADVAGALTSILTLALELGIIGNKGNVTSVCAHITTQHVLYVYNKINVMTR